MDSWYRRKWRRKQCKKSSVTIYVVNVGDTLWELAKNITQQWIH